MWVYGAGHMLDGWGQSSHVWVTGHQSGSLYRPTRSAVEGGWGQGLMNLIGSTWGSRGQVMCGSRARQGRACSRLAMALPKPGLPSLKL